MFWVGVLLGCVISLLAAGLASIALHRRLVALERRTLQAERLAELGTLTGGLAHEIKNPLSTVQLNLQLLHEDLVAESVPPRIVSRLGTVQRETGRLREILDDFLRYAGKIELDKRETDLRDLLEELVDFFTPQAQVQRVQLRLRVPETPVSASVDPKLLKQAILNLMINGLQAMSGSGGELILSLDAEPRQVRIEVTDTGIGIPPEAAQRIFDAYYSTKKGGTGLGLAMTRRIVHEHDGSIEVQSDAGKGTRFTIRLPR